MRATNGQKILDMVHTIAISDKVNSGVAKARIASESEFSVPLLERLMRGECVSSDAQVRICEVAKARGLNFSMDDLFPLVDASENEAPAAKKRRRG